MPIRSLCAFLISLLTLANGNFLFSQNQAPVSDPQAVALANLALSALTNGVAVSDVTLSGNATWIAGSDKETGPATLQAKGAGESRIDLKVSGGTRTEVHNDTPGSPQGESIAPDGTVQPWPQHNCWINGGWFFPALSILAATPDPSVIFTYVGVESRDTGSVQHLRAYRYLASKKPGLVALVTSLSTEDIYLDSTSFHPVAFIFNTHPDDDEATNISVEIDFSDYQLVSSAQIPMHVQKLINGGLAVDIAVTNAVVNSGLSDDLFAIQ
jgi:hypothetical protein